MILTLLVPYNAQAVHDTGIFQLDGDAQSSTNTALTPGALDDWDKVCYEQGVKPVSAGGDGLTPPQATARCGIGTPTSGATAVSWVAEPSPNSSFFTGGGSKDPIDIDQWAWKDLVGGLPDKDNLEHGFSVRYSEPPSANCPSGGNPTCELIFFGSDRFDNSGDAQQGFWFFQNRITLGSNKIGGGTGFNGVHANGDILVISDFSNGGTVSTISVLKWDTACTATNKPFGYCADANLHLLETSDAANCVTSAFNDPFCGLVNPANGVVAPWPYQDKSGNATYLQGELLEAGINLSLLPNVASECFASFLAETRSSTSTTATLKDFVLGNFGNCVATMTTQVSSAGPLTPGTAVHDTATVVGNRPSITPSGTVTFFLCGPIATGACDGTTNVGTNIGTGPLSGSGTTASANSPDVNTGIGLTPGRYCFRAEWPGDANYTTPLKEFGGTDGTNECFTVAKVPSSTVTTPVDGSGTPKSAIQLGDSIFDKAVVTGVVVGGIPTGTVSFFICGPIATGTCDTGGTAVTGNPVALDAGTVGPPPSASATSGAVTPAAVGRYCFRGEYSGDNHYLASSDSGLNECFTVSTTSSTSSTQTWLPNDSATVTSAAPLSGSLSFTLHQGGDCTGAVLRSAETFTFSGATSPVTRSTTNTSVSVTTSSTVSWEVVFASTDSFVSGSSRCESTILTIAN
ncbi:MAG: hypothetical protein AUH33_05695 [Chloroflexi bacterium 13_1_40CM_68_21]|nr:MAG: hypothetical protein AUH33_05695 [Chloroflexi bacterium 13_1_40CM_68_21]